jgi:hypothetical protein
MVCSEIPIRRMTSATGVPVSAGFSPKAICFCIRISWVKLSLRARHRGFRASVRGRPYRHKLGAEAWWSKSSSAHLPAKPALRQIARTHQAIAPRGPRYR